MTPDALLIKSITVASLLKKVKTPFSLSVTEERFGVRWLPSCPPSVRAGTIRQQLIANGSHA